jgi:aspartate/glutamate racemase
MKSVGVIGGLGPETTSEFYLEVIFQCQSQNDKQRPLIVISSVPLLFEIERDLIDIFHSSHKRPNDWKILV